ncbi:unnamed protein product [Trichobilharzia regenti]|nr:unnamed protein product [Trichobilharzia regenti]
MEGVLLKWTNYVSGWQQRYFILDDGVLSYYRSKEEMDSGCKGSVKLSVCDVIVHSSDARRFDLILGEQRYYLRALSRSDRQRWVVALGNSKVGNIPPKCEDVNVCEKGANIYICIYISYRSRIEPSQTQSIDSHRSELRLYHNLMVQQVKEIQSNLKEDKIPDMNVRVGGFFLFFFFFSIPIVVFFCSLSLFFVGFRFNDSYYNCIYRVYLSYTMYIYMCINVCQEYAI